MNIIFTLAMLLGGMIFPSPTWAKSQTPIQTSPNATNLIFVFTGESNSGGMAPNTNAIPSELAPIPQVRILNNQTFKFEDLNIGTNNNIDHWNLTCCDTHGFELQLANSVKANAFTKNPQVYLVKTGQGLSTLSAWNVGGTFWTKFLQRINATKTLIPTPRQWVVWYSLGINDYVSGTPPGTFKTLTIAHLNKIKSELPGAIIIMTQFQSMGDIYTETLAKIASTEPNVYVVGSTGATLDSSAYHWTYNGYKTMASRMVTITNNTLLSTTPIPGDLNGDNKVDIFDYNLFFSNFGKTGNLGFTTSDINQDGRVDSADYDILIVNFRK